MPEIENFRNYRDGGESMVEYGKISKEIEVTFWNKRVDDIPVFAKKIAEALEGTPIGFSFDGAKAGKIREDDYIRIIATINQNATLNIERAYWNEDGGYPGHSELNVEFDEENIKKNIVNSFPGTEEDIEFYFGETTFSF